MGRATSEKSEQVLYIQTRLKLIYDMSLALGEDALAVDLDNLIQQMDNLQIKLDRFKKDWDKEPD